MSFEFGNTSLRVGNIERMVAMVGGTAHIERQQFLEQWHSPRALNIDFQKLGVDPTMMVLDTSDCVVSYEYADHGHIVFLTEYNNSQAMEKDIELINAANREGCVKWYGLQVAITMDAPTGAAFRSALLRARR